jgi:hypothetical protein
MIDVTIDGLRTVNSQNVREHWSKRAARAKQHRVQAWAELRAADNAPRCIGPVTVTLTRIAPRRMDDDGAIASLKAVRDGVADWLGIDDGSNLITWRYAQTKGAPKKYAVRIEVTHA